VSKTIDAKVQRRDDAEHSAPRPRATAFKTRSWLLGVLRSFPYAFAGIGWMLRTQRNAQIHVAITCAVIIAGFFFRISAGEWLVLIAFITLVLALEALNTALEAVVDLASPQFHPLAKRAKDAAAGAVLIGAIGSVVAGAIVFLPKMLALIL
jgi:diacylglycerol kinase